MQLAVEETSLWRYFWTVTVLDFLNELTFTLFNYREAGVMGAESRVAVDREGKHPIVEVPIRTNDGGQQIKKNSKQWKTTKTILKTTLQENETALTPDIAILVSRVYFLLSDVIKRLPEVWNLTTTNIALKWLHAVLSLGNFVVNFHTFECKSFRPQNTWV